MQINSQNDLLVNAKKGLKKTQQKPQSPALCKTLRKRFKKWNAKHPLLTTLYPNKKVLIGETFQEQDIAERTSIIVSRMNAGIVIQKMASVYAVKLFKQGVNQDMAIRQGFNLAERLKHQGVGRFDQQLTRA